jgi:hypothetical protein
MKLKVRLNSMGKVFLYMLILVLISSVFIKCRKSSGGNGTQLEQGFLNPPDEAKPRVWWHWMNGNITKEGIRADLEWMNRIGIGGFQNFDAALNTPQIVEKRLVYMTPEWKDAFKFTTALADSLGLEMAIAGSPGWSESGGPWVKPEEAMKKLVWSETRVEGGKPFTGSLPRPPSETGAFQNLGSNGGGFSLTGASRVQKPEFYADVAVVAFKIPEGDKTMMELQPMITSSGGNFNLEMLTDGDLQKTSLLPATVPGQNAWIQYEFKVPETVGSITLVGGSNSGRFGGRGNADDKTLEYSDDGRTFSKITGIISNRVGQVTLTFPPVTAKYFRLNFRTPPPAPARTGGGMFGGGGRGPQTPAGTQIAEFVLYNTSRVNRFEEKAGFSVALDLSDGATPTVNPAEAVAKNTIIDLTSKMHTDGTLDWTPESGKWVILRLGYSLTGHENGPASPEATGLEVDKLSADHVRKYFTTYLDMYKDATGGLMGNRGLQYIITDSWEAGVQNWTENMPEDFKNNCGYDLIPWLPAIAGYVIESAGSTDNFLWDFRKTIAGLTVKNHYDLLTEMLKERGMGRYTESHEDGRAFIGDGMEVKKTASVPMSATWTPTGNETEVQTRFKADVRESASVSHIYGQKYVAAESMTAIGTAWAWSPELLKPTADMELANGLNRFVIHTSVHQPLNDKIPGLGLGPFGQWFTRHETWAEQAGPWMTYLARNCFMLQQGKFIADVAYYYGEDNNITALYGVKMPDIPQGYNYDFINADALTNALSVNKGIITTPAGTTYRLLALDPGINKMSVPVLRKIYQMVNDGAIVVGNKPVESPSLGDSKDEFNKIADELWAKETGENNVGAGKVFAGQNLQDVLNTLNITPDFSYTKPQDNTSLLFVHRQLDNIDFYWVNNRNPRVEEVDAKFRVSGKTAEIWNPVTGSTEQASFTMEDVVTKVPLRLEPNDAVFVVFRNKTGKKSVSISKPQEKQLAIIEGPWNVSFQERRGALPHTTFETLTQWNDNGDPGIRYFSGEGTYSKTINVPADWIKDGDRLWLDLGDVKNLAEVTVNGKSLGIVWKTPFRVDLTGVLKEGENSFDVKVTNLWVNRLIGDQQPGATEKITYTTMAFYRPDSSLKPSGLLGPVKIISISD